MRPDVSVIVVSYNARELLGECLASIEAEAAPGLAIETIVVDNQSTDGSADWVREHHPKVRVIDAGRNGGMGAGNNVGMCAARGAAFLLLNSDARLTPGSLAAMLHELDADDQVALVGPRLLNADGSLQRSARGFPTVWRLATEFWYLRRLAPRSRLFNSLYAGWFDHRSRVELEWVSGACMLVSRSAVERVGLMNEAYFMFNEETDWQRRLARAGNKVVFTPAAEVVHLGGGSTGKQWGRMYQVQLVSHLRYLATCESTRSAARARRVIASALLVRWLLYRVAAVLPGSGRDRRLQRAQAFRLGRRAVLDADVAALGAQSIPPFEPAVQQPVT